MSKISILHIFGSVTRMMKNNIDIKKINENSEIIQDEVKSIATSESRKDIACVAYINMMVCYEIGPNGIKVI